MSVEINQELVNEINKVLYNKDFSQFLVDHTTDPAVAMVILQLLFDGVNSMQETLNNVDKEEKL